MKMKTFILQYATGSKSVAALAKELGALKIRKENSEGDLGRTNYSETNCEDAITALGGFETSVRVMLDRLSGLVATA